MANKWIEHVKKVRSENPDLTQKEALIMAKETYNKIDVKEIKEDSNLNKTELSNQPIESGGGKPSPIQSKNFTSPVETKTVYSNMDKKEQWNEHFKPYGYKVEKESTIDFYKKGFFVLFVVLIICMIAFLIMAYDDKFKTTLTNNINPSINATMNNTVNNEYNNNFTNLHTINVYVNVTNQINQVNVTTYNFTIGNSS